MFARKKHSETCIPVSLDEPLTSDSCATLIMELIKYILYQKQQIPFTYDALTQLHARFKPTDRNSCSTKTMMSSLRCISENLTSQLHLGDCDVKEIVIIIGATTISPKLCIRLELPGEILSSRSHMEYQHSSRKPLMNLMRSMIECEEFQEALNAPLGLTNTFVMLRKNDSNPTSDFFMPKPHYAPPTQTPSCFAIKLSHGPEMETNCSCNNAIRVYHDLPLGARDTNLDVNGDNEDFVVRSRNDCPYMWYQSREVIKGFKFFR